MELTQILLQPAEVWLPWVRLHFCAGYTRLLISRGKRLGGRQCEDTGHELIALEAIRRVRLVCSCV